MPRFIIYEIPSRDFHVSEVREVYYVATDFLSGFAIKDLGEVFKATLLNTANFYILEINTVFVVSGVTSERFIVANFNPKKEKNIHPYYYYELPFWSVNYGIVFDWLGVIFDHFYRVVDIPPREFIFQEVA